MRKKDAIISIRVSKELKTALTQLAKATIRRESDILNQWITEKVEQELWQLQKVETGLADIEIEDIEK